MKKLFTAQGGSELQEVVGRPRRSTAYIA
ncbi:hypothetical protein ACSQ67_024663 [Phaseolus vulgaris]